MKVYVYPADLNGCGNYRLIWPAQALQEQGHDVTIVKPSERDDPKLGIRGMIQRDEIIDMVVPEDADLIVMQRVTHKFLCKGIKHLRKKGIAVVVDMDDDLSRIHPSNPAFTHLHPRNGTEHNWENARIACDNATIVTVSTAALKKVYAPRGNGVVLNNYLPPHAYTVPREDWGDFGWTGAAMSHPNDPAVMGPSVNKLIHEGFPFAMIGNQDGIHEIFGVPKDKFIRFSGVLDQSGWYDGLTTLHVGIAPLADTTFNKAKSWLKPLELAAVGVPTVMSPRAEYVKLHRLGVGVLAGSPSEWYTQVKRLMTDAAWYDEVTERSVLAVSNLSYREQAYQWAATWEAAWLTERKQHSVFARRSS